MPRQFLSRLFANEAGASAVEYGLIAALIALAALTAIVGVGNEVNSDFETIRTSYEDAAG